MATVAIGLPLFDLDGDLERFISLFLGYLNGLGINPLIENDGPPTSRDRALGLLRSCMKGRAAEWYDQHILNKNIKLRNILRRAAHGAEAAFKGTALNHANCAVADFLGQALAIRNANPGNVAPHVWPDYTLTVHDNVWQTVANIEFTGEALNHNDAGGGGAGAAGVGFAYVIPARLCHAFAKMRRDLPQQQRARREIKFVNLIQGDSPIREFYEKVRHSGQLLGFGREVVAHQFYRGLNEENTLEAQRFRDDRDVEQLVDDLERLEQTKAEMGALSRRKASYYLDPPKETTTPQEPITLKASSDVERLLKQQAEIFQTQIRELQKSLKPQQQPLRQKRVAPPVVKKPPLEYDPEYMPSDWYDPLPDEAYYADPDEPEEKPFSELSEEQKQQIFDRVLGNTKRNERDLVKRIARKLRQAKDKREDRELAQAMRDLTIDDNSMDVDVMRSQKLELEEDNDGNIYVVRAGVKKK
jgi:hypothetical protein